MRALVSIVALTAVFGSAQAAENPFLGSWALQLPGGAPGWLGVEETNGQLRADLLWDSGSVQPTASAKIEGDKLILVRNLSAQTKDASGKTVRRTIPETFTVSVAEDQMKLSGTRLRADARGDVKLEFTGQRLPPMPPAPDLSQVKFGEPLRLFNGKDLAGWRLTNPRAINGWSAKNGLLINRAVQEEGQPHKNYGNLRTEQEFEDFNLTLEAHVAKGGNSGVYLRGIYEVQVADTFGRAPDSHNMGAIYSRLKPTASAEKPAGEWQTLDITLVQRHATVVLNGVKIIDNQPVAGCTGGALWSDVTRAGPIYLQGDHTSIEYRNLVLRPVLK